MPATSLSLGSLLQALGFKQQETFPLIEAVQPVLVMGDASDHVNVPMVPTALWGQTHTSGGVGNNTIRIYSHAPGGIIIDNVQCNSASPAAVVASVNVFSFAVAAAFPLVAPTALSAVDVSQNSAGPITTTAERGDNPTGLINNNLPGVVMNTLSGASGPLGPIYVQPGNVFTIFGEGAVELNVFARVRELPEIPAAR